MDNETSQAQESVLLAQSGHLFPMPPSRASLWRWALRGRCGGVRLATFVCGGRRYVTPRAVAEFIESCTAASESKTLEHNTVDIAAVRSRSLAGRDQDRVVAELDAIGIRARSSRRDRGKEGN